MSYIKASFYPSHTPLENASSVAVRGLRKFNELLRDELLRRKNNWKRLLKRRKDRAFESGFRAGIFEAKLSFLEKGSELNQLYKEFLSYAESECVTLSLKVSEGIILESFETSRDLVSSRVKSLLKKGFGSTFCKVIVHPIDAHHLKAALKSENLEIIESSDLKRGDMEIQTLNGSVWLSVEDSIEMMRREFFLSLSSSMKGENR